MTETADASLAAAIDRATQEHEACLCAARSRRAACPVAEAEAFSEMIAPSLPPEVMSPERCAANRRRIRDERLADRAEKRRAAHAWKRIDLIALRIICKPGEFRALIKKAYSFALAHALGFVSEQTRAKRLRRCDDCTYRIEETLPILGSVAYCTGDNGGRGCGCIRHPLWPFATLGYKTSLGNYACPIAKFPRRWFDRGWGFRWWVWLSCLSAFGVGGLAAWMIAG